MIRRIKSMGLVLLGGLLFSTACHASRSSCPPDTEPPSQKPVLYEVKDQRLWRHETETGRYSPVTDIHDVRTVAQSVLNCISQIASSHEPNMVIVSKTDGTVWIKGVIWNYAFDECAVDCVKPLGPQRMLDTKGQWKQIVGFKDVVKVVAGETWVVALTRSGQVAKWGTVNGTFIWSALPAETQSHLPPLQYTPYPIFDVPPVYVDLVAFHNAVYGLTRDGQVTAWADGHLICRNEVLRKYRGGNHVCPFVSSQQGKVDSIWQTVGKPEECNAAFTGGQHWRWPCDLRDENSLLATPIVPNQIRKGRLAGPAVPHPR